jgi:ABC-type multidrug transport system ATPase subunit
MINTLEFDSLYLEFGLHRVLSSVYMSCSTGQIVGLLGRNGSGKSCLMQVVFGTMNAENKSVRFNKIPLIENYVRKKVISYLPQTDMLPSFMTFGNALDLYEIDHQPLVDQFPELDDCLKRKSSEVSGGQRRFFEVLMVLHSRHPFCILDEPFSGLMPIHVEKLKEIFKEEKSRKGIIITDHLHRHIREIADELYLLTNGKTYKVLEEEQLIELGYVNEL